MYIPPSVGKSGIMRSSGSVIRKVFEKMEKAHDVGKKRPSGATPTPDPKRIPKPGSEEEFLKRMKGRTR